MAQQIITPNLNLSLPGDDSHNTPWGAADQLLATAVSAIDAQLVVGIQSQAWVYGNDTGAANAYAITLSPAPTIAAGFRCYFLAAHANSGASTLSVNGGAAKAITKSGTTALAGAEISANQIVQVVYDGTRFQLISQ